jgi:hypothetical protein
MVALHRRELVVLGDNPYDKKLVKRLESFDWEMSKEFIIRYLKHITRCWSDDYLKYKASQKADDSVTIEQIAELKLLYKNKKK